MSKLWIHTRYSGDWWGETPIYETEFEHVGDLFRALSGRDKHYSVDALGRCTGTVYVDDENGEPKQAGWVFEARNPEPENRGDTQPTGLRIAWVTVHDAPPTVTKTYHYTAFGD